MEKTYATIPEADEAYRRELEEAKRRETLMRRRERDHLLREGAQRGLEIWERQRTLLESMVERAGSGPAQALETTRQAVLAGDFDTALAAAVSISAFECVLALAQGELDAHMAAQPVLYEP
jgi:hypothetical protein